MFEGANYGRTVTNDHVHCSTWYAPSDIANGTVLDTMIAEINPTQHVTCANHMYADGHAVTVSYDTFLRLGANRYRERDQLCPAAKVTITSLSTWHFKQGLP